MKKAFLVLFTLFFSCAIQAATLTQNFVSTDNKVFSIDQARELSFPTGAVTVIFVDGNSSYVYLADVGGGVAVKVKASANFSKFVQLGTTGRYLRPEFAKYITCSSSGTVIGWNVGGAETIADGCAFHAVVKALSN